MIEFLRSYSIRDFLLFSRETYFSTLVSYNEWLWPGQIAFVLASFLVLYFVLRGRVRPLLALSSLAWGFTGFAFHLRHFIGINWAAKYLGWLFLIQAVLLLAALASSFRIRARGTWQFRIGVVLFLISAFVPLLWLRDYPCRAITLFGWGAEMTALGTLGLMLAMQGRRWPFLLAPTLYLVVAFLVETSL